MSDILKEAKLQLFIALGVTIPFIVYSVGRWYKEWYFAQFRVHYGMFRYDVPYFMFGSWASMLVATSVILIVVNVWLRFALLGSIMDRSIAICLFLLALVRVFVLRLEFNPDQVFITKLLTSADLSLACIGMAAFLHGALSLGIRSEAFAFFERVLNASPLTWWISIFIFWIYCFGVGYALGTYHGQKAIWEGKMGLQWVTIKGLDKRWILVEQADGGRVFVFDRERTVSRLVKRDDIDEMQELVSPIRK